ncbi:hypothetical protein [Legionella shakespearei]|uniref:DNA-directed DNA polymerase n=1 Tax=Legionella shakespearei DSM 23087 TaxID=1122169 RepID=A0A0W0YX87_9GAMM|nr:hypothetical protein [Legionella shakespearei]KTD61474.1 DNA polymerase III subunit delta' [Legionella shakespearei DSM 23087]
MNHIEQWKKIQTAATHQRIPQAMLFVGPLHCALADFAIRIMQLLHCKINSQEPCLACLDCTMVQNSEHPDVLWVKPEKAGSAIKIDQVRELQNSAFLTPQRAQHRIIVLEAADKMNTASANALLKILEEPADHTVFILIAQQLSTVLPTILSRCQILTFSSPDDARENNLLALGDKYPEESERSAIVKQSEVILEGLIALIEQREHPCILAAQWSQYELGTLLWFLYLVYSQLQYMHFTATASSGPAIKQLQRLLALSNPILIFSQIDKINTLLKKLSHNMNINHTLVLEDLLFSLISK